MELEQPCAELKPEGGRNREQGQMLGGGQPAGSASLIVVLLSEPTSPVPFHVTLIGVYHIFLFLISFSSFSFPSVILSSLLLCFCGQCHHFPQLQVPFPTLISNPLSSSGACLLSSKPIFPKCSLEMTPAKFYRHLALTYHKGNFIMSSKLLLSLYSIF